MYAHHTHMPMHIPTYPPRLPLRPRVYILGSVSEKIDLKVSHACTNLLTLRLHFAILANHENTRLGEEPTHTFA